MKKLLNDFKAFAMQGNVVNLAVGVMIGGAFGKIVSSLVGDIFMPLLGLITGGVDMSGLFIALNGKHYATAQDAVSDGAGTLNYGAFLTNIIDFILIAMCVFAFVRLIGKLFPPKPPAVKPPVRQCPYCLMDIHPAATRCPYCTEPLEPAETASPEKAGA